MPYEIHLKKNEEKRIVAGHSWVYANEIAKIDGCEPGIYPRPAGPYLSGHDRNLCENESKG